jgi:hypothetical protein
MAGCELIVMCGTLLTQVAHETSRERQREHKSMSGWRFIAIIPGDKRKYIGPLDDVFLSKLMYNDNGAEGVNMITVSVMVGILVLSLLTTVSPDTLVMERFFQASKCQLPSFSTNSHPSVQKLVLFNLGV